MQAVRLTERSLARVGVTLVTHEPLESGRPAAKREPAAALVAVPS
jgi:hypothetical protein